MNAGKISYQELYEAYLDCRKHKRNTMNALAFELDVEEKLLDLLYEINEGTYRIGRSVAFIVNRPVKREIFAAGFRDRIVHHLVVNKLNHLFERHFIYDSYSCRIGKGTHFGINRVNGFIRSCSQNYTKDCYVLKLDIKGFFMHINRTILWHKVESIINNYYFEGDKALLLSLCRQIIENDPTAQCVFKGGLQSWRGLPRDKSLFYSPYNCGLPIGNLTSQVFANLYLTGFDHFVKSELKVRYYGRYVDDFVLVHENKHFLLYLIPIIQNYLNTKLHLDLHPKKIHLLHYTKGLKWLGAYIKPYRTCVSHRTKTNLYLSIMKSNDLVRSRRPEMEEIEHFVSSINSYFGLMRQFQTYRLRKKMFHRFSAYWCNHVYASGGYSKIVKKVKRVRYLNTFHN